ncbi:MAG: glycosyl transferase family 1 [Nitrospinaceae bacterium]|nr:MAG: glycosyl transferase family 1 [Nitrospinaceae bacterium]
MIYLQNLNKQYGKKILFKDVNLHLRPKEKLGLIGENGMGKTTLFRVITQMESADSGQVVVRKGAQLAMLAQELTSDGETILERVVMGDAHFADVSRKMHSLEKNTRLHEESPEKWSRQYGELQHEFERLHGYERESRAQTILSGLGFKADQWEKPLSEFSGGWRMRVELARLLSRKPDVLLLDEPTNHLDLRSVIWLESFLKSYEGSILLISHDRRFLNGIIKGIVELDRGSLTRYTGNYDNYESLKEAREEQLQAEAVNQRKKIADIEKFVERFRAKASKATQVQSRVKMLSKMDRVETATKSRTIHFRFPQPARTGRMIIELSDVDKSYGPVEVYKNFSTRLERGSKVALVGENGAGKSTLLKLMAGVLGHDNGEIKLGANVTRAYYAQHHSETLVPEHTVLESLEETAGHLMRTQKHNILGAFLFSGDDVNKKVGVLSGGERSRLALARILSNPASFLLLDEPTNHLDMRSTEFLAAALADYEGSLCAISHDRYFLDGIINRVWEVENGTVKEYIGNYSDYEYFKSKEAEREQAKVSETGSKKNNQSGQKNKERKRAEAKERSEKHRQIKPKKSRLSEVEQRLEQVGTEKSKAEQELGDPDIHQAGEKVRLLEVLHRQKELSKEEDRLMQEWDELTRVIDQWEAEFANK